MTRAKSVLFFLPSIKVLPTPARSPAPGLSHLFANCALAQKPTTEHTAPDFTIALLLNMMEAFFKELFICSPAPF